MASPYSKDYDQKNSNISYMPVEPDTDSQNQGPPNYGLPSEYRQQQPYAPNTPMNLVIMQPSPQVVPQTVTSTFVHESNPHVIVVNPGERGCCSCLCDCFRAICGCVGCLIVFVLLLICGIVVYVKENMH